MLDHFYEFLQRRTGEYVQIATLEKQPRWIFTTMIFKYCQQNIISTIGKKVIYKQVTKIIQEASQQVGFFLKVLISKDKNQHQIVLKSSSTT